MLNTVHVSLYRVYIQLTSGKQLKVACPQYDVLQIVFFCDKSQIDSMDSVTFQLPSISLSRMHLAILFIQYPGTLKLNA